MNRRPIRIAIVSIGLLLVLSVGWYLASPLFINKTVNEALPQEVVGLQELIEAPSDEELAQIAEEARKAMAEASVAELAGEPDKVMEEEMPASANPNRSAKSPGVSTCSCTIRATRSGAYICSVSRTVCANACRAIVQSPSRKRYGAYFTKMDIT